jgi:hypothetical protein
VSVFISISENLIYLVNTLTKLFNCFKTKISYKINLFTKGKYKYANGGSSLVVRIFGCGPKDSSSNLGSGLSIYYGGINEI